MVNEPIGFGSAHPRLAVYVEKRPPMPEYACLEGIQALQPGDIEQINRQCGNGWRKLFNVYAKLLYALNPVKFAFSLQAPDWQHYRDAHLLQGLDGTALLFSPPRLIAGEDTIHLVAGRTWARRCLAEGLACQLHWLDEAFAIAPDARVLVSPYFDYRQLNNEKIIRLAALMSELPDAPGV